MTISYKFVRFGLSVAAVLTSLILVTGVISPVLNPAYASTSVGGRAMVMSIASSLGAVNFMDTVTKYTYKIMVNQVRTLITMPCGYGCSANRLSI